MEEKRRLYIRIMVMLCSVGFIIAGIMRDEHTFILRKAVKLCLECIGIG